MRTHAENEIENVIDPEAVGWHVGQSRTAHIFSLRELLEIRHGSQRVPIGLITRRAIPKAINRGDRIRIGRAEHLAKLESDSGPSRRKTALISDAPSLRAPPSIPNRIAARVGLRSAAPPDGKSAGQKQSYCNQRIAPREILNGSGETGSVDFVSHV